MPARESWSLISPWCGHEGVGMIEQVGAGVTRFRPGDDVLISCITACGKCEYCRRGMYSHCTTGGWILGNTIDGTQAEYVRIPHADTSLYPIPPGADEEALVMLSDILPTGFECGVLNGKVGRARRSRLSGPGRSVSPRFSPRSSIRPREIIMIDLDDNRLEVARRLARRRRSTARTERRPRRSRLSPLVAARIRRSRQWACLQHSCSAKIWWRPAASSPMLACTEQSRSASRASLVRKYCDHNATCRHGHHADVAQDRPVQKIDPKLLITHRFKLDEILDAYDTFGHAASTGALKVIIEA